MKSIDISEIAAITPFLNADDREPVIVTENGRVVATVIPTEDDDVESLLLSVNPKFQQILERSQQRLESEGGLTSDDVRAKLGLAARSR